MRTLLLRGTSLRLLLVIRTASQEVRANMRTCAVAVTLRPA